MQFVYVMSQEDKEKMIAMGYSLLKKHPENNVWVFKNYDVVGFSDDDRLVNADISFVLSDVLRF